MIKKLIFSLTCLCLVTGLFSQTPQAFNYQAVVRDASGTTIKNQAVGIRISLLNGSDAGPVEYSETHAASTNELGIVNLKIGQGTVQTGNITGLNWAGNTYFMKVELDESGGTSYSTMGVSQLLTVPVALYAVNGANWKQDTNATTTDKLVGIGTDSPSSMFEIRGNNNMPDSALFAVKDKLGNIIFAVYETGVKVYISEGKGGKGGFVVGGRTAKGSSTDLMQVTPDSIRFYINSPAKGGKGGFAVGGRSAEKGFMPDLLKIDLDSLRVNSPDTRFNIPDNSMNDLGTGFFVGSKSTLGQTNDFFNINPSNTATMINPSQARVLWYPQKEAFLVGRVLVEHPDSVGTNSIATGYESKAIGRWSQAFGYKTVAKKDYSTAIGRDTRASGLNAFALGSKAQSNADDAYAIGSGAAALGKNSFALGSVMVDSLGMVFGSPTTATGDYSVALGMGAGAQGSSSLAINGTAVGGVSRAIGGYAYGYNSTAIGYNTRAMGNYSVAMGYGSASFIFGKGTEDFVIGPIIKPPIFKYTSYPVTAQGAYSMALGVSTVANGYYSTAMGYRTQAQAYNSFVLGRYNSFSAAEDTDTWVTTDPLFTIGNGSGSSSRSNAMVVLKNGELDLYSNEAWYGIFSSNNTTTHGSYGIYTQSYGANSSYHYGLYAYAGGGNSNFAVYGYASIAANSYAGYFAGNVHITGTLSKSAGSFKIDHPQDPENKTLSHSFVESPEMKNVYDGIVVLDASGEAWVALPSYFEALNETYRYQLTSIGVPGPNLYVASEITGNNFKIAGGSPGQKVSWMVTGVRKDPYAKQHPIIVEEQKTGDNQGKYLNPEVYGQPASKGVGYQEPPEGEPRK
ncbi:MAG: hypothetical protein U0T82_13545 [Bacteroidales bacterium]